MKHYTTSLSLWMALIMMVSLVGMSPAWSKPRKDLDGKRIGARSMSLDKERKDKLNAPQDRSDWSYLKLREAGSLVVTLKSNPEGAAVMVTLTDASGTVLGSKKLKAKGGTVSLASKVKAGIYYIQVSSEDEVRYSLTATLKPK